MVSRPVPRRGMSSRAVVAASLASAALALGGCAWGTASSGASPTAPATRAAVASSAAPPSSAPSPVPSTPSSPVATSPTPSPTPSPAASPVASPHTPAPRATPAAAATVAVTYSLWDAATASVEVAGYVADIVESGGACTLTLTSAGRTVSVAQKATPDATTTSCGMLFIPRAKLPASGAWSAVLGYASAHHAGSAPAVTVEVP